MRAKRDLFRSLTLAAMVDSASRMCRGLPLPSLEVAASYIRTYDGRDDLRAARTPKYVSFPSLVVVIVPLSFRYRFALAPFTFPSPWLILCRSHFGGSAHWAGLDRPPLRFRFASAATGVSSAVFAITPPLHDRTLQPTLCKEAPPIRNLCNGVARVSKKYPNSSLPSSPTCN